MKSKVLYLSFVVGLGVGLSFCTSTSSSVHLVRTWRLVSGATITKGVTEVTDYNKSQRMIKIINESHFAFLKHELGTAKDSSNHFDAGGGVTTAVNLRIMPSALLIA